jgi:predicted nucleic acid-binding protein
VPSIWPLEVANAVLAGLRAKRLDETDVQHFLALLDNVPVQIDRMDFSGQVARVLPLAREFSLSAYDAAYLELAIRLGMPLATIDRKLKSAALRAGVVLLEG